MNQRMAQSGSKLYGVPRRFDLMTMMIVTHAYSLLFGFMKLLSFHPAVFASLAGFITTVGLAQALLFKGKKPRMSSILTGFAFTTIYAAILIIVIIPHMWYSSYFELVIMACFLGVSGIPFGYLAGGLVAGIFLVADVARKRFKY